MEKKALILKLVGLVLVVALCFFAAKDFLAMHEDDIIVETENLTEIRMLSEWNPALKGTDCDTPVYVFKGEREGGSMVILGGTHESEIAAVMSAICFVENVKVNAGTLYVIPHANNSAITCTTPLEGAIDFFTLTLADGSTRTFRCGNRYTNPVDQWPDPNYNLGSSGRELINGETPEIRNLNRNYPGIGEESRYLTQRACYAIYNLIVSEGVDVLYDGHEATPEFKRVDYMIAHDTAMLLASTTSVNLMLEGIDMKVDLSGASSWGLSHRGLGDNTDAFCTLVETINPTMASLHGKMSYNLMINGVEPNYMSEAGRAAVIAAAGTQLTETNGRLDNRVAFHASACIALTESYTEMFPDDPIEIEGVPRYQEFVALGLAGVLKPVNEN